MITKQVKFYDKKDKRWCGGIMIDDQYIICGCCGSVFKCDNFATEEIEPYDYWVNISDEIIGN
jgi:hypothetical protein